MTLRTEMITVNDGLSQGLITWFMQDKEGFMWFGTKEGLNKYDGYNFAIYRHQQDDRYSLPDNYIATFIEDDNGNFRVGTLSKGLCLFDKRKERFYPFKISGSDESLSSNSVSPWHCQNGKLMVRNMV